ncbi:MAG: 50S ribosomal protein L18 [Omnitrophica WOR_2 bacterium RIFCSPLOWO2_12_FULL_51_8]|nr:MAG: 50S ribosomal protein L18 [Omnitrophica WOR_2 bacterium RIFCSPLOWO2_12_FULL_51_8]
MKEDLRAKRHRAIKLRMRGTAEIPRLVVRRSLTNMSAQVIDDAGNKTLLSLASYDKGIKGNFPSSGNVKSAEGFGAVFAAKAKEKGITKIIFDRAGYLYHGRIKAFADALRKGGLKF